MKKIMFIFGTRPEFIKLYPIIMECQKQNFDIAVVNTGQHQEMLDEIMVQFNFTADYDLHIMEKCEGLTDIFCETLSGLDGILEAEKPDLVIVHGDTLATISGSLQAFYHHVPVAHVEAGLRTYDKYAPFPEEMNRHLTDVIADLYFAPTQATEQNLIQEGIKKTNIHVVGNSAIDMLNYTITADFSHEFLEWSKDSKLILATVHRRENLSDLVNIFEAFNQICQKHSNVKILYPMHMNPKIRKLAKKTLSSRQIKMIEPMDVITFHNIMKRSYFILTDSGGIQEEAPALGKPVLVMRDTTERPEGVEVGTLKLVGTKTENIVEEVDTLLNDSTLYQTMSSSRNPYGDGNTSQQIVKIIQTFLQDEI